MKGELTQQLWGGSCRVQEVLQARLPLYVYDYPVWRAGDPAAASGKSSWAQGVLHGGLAAGTQGVLIWREGWSSSCCGELPGPAGAAGKIRFMCMTTRERRADLVATGGRSSWAQRAAVRVSCMYVGYRYLVWSESWPSSCWLQEQLDPACCRPGWLCVRKATWWKGRADPAAAGAGAAGPRGCCRQDTATHRPTNQLHKLLIVQVLNPRLYRTCLSNMYVYMYIYTYTYIHTYIHTYIYTVYITYTHMCI